jgi:hypothetical protein
MAETVDDRLHTEDLLDAYITGTNVSDWEILIEYLEAQASPVQYFNGNDPIERPGDLESVLTAVSSFAPGYSMAIDLGGDVIRSFFFDVAEVDFNFRVRNPGEPLGAEILERFLAFLQDVANVLKRPVEVTPEGIRDEVLVQVHPEPDAT